MRVWYSSWPISSNVSTPGMHFFSASGSCRVSHTTWRGASKVYEPSSFIGNRIPDNVCDESWHDRWHELRRRPYARELLPLRGPGGGGWLRLPVGGRPHRLDKTHARSADDTRLLRSPDQARDHRHLGPNHAAAAARRAGQDAGHHGLPVQRPRGGWLWRWRREQEGIRCLRRAP